MCALEGAGLQAACPVLLLSWLGFALLGFPHISSRTPFCGNMKSQPESDKFGLSNLLLKCSESR